MQLGGKHTLGIEETVGVSTVVVLPLLLPGNGVGIDGGGGAAGKTSDVMGSVPEVNVATVAPMAAFLAAVLPPSTVKFHSFMPAQKVRAIGSVALLWMRL